MFYPHTVGFYAWSSLKTKGNYYGGNRTGDNIPRIVVLPALVTLPSNIKIGTGGGAIFLQTSNIIINVRIPTSYLIRGIDAIQTFFKANANPPNPNYAVAAYNSAIAAEPDIFKAINPLWYNDTGPPVFSAEIKALIYQTRTALIEAQPSGTALSPF